MHKKLLYALGLCTLVVCGTFLFWPSSELPSMDSADLGQTEVDSANVFAAEIRTVKLPPSKLASAAIQVETVERRALQATCTLPGRLDYDQNRHVSIHSACEGILTEILVQPGNEVTRGQVVARISSPEVGQARSEVQSRLASLQLALNEQKRNSEICSGVEELVALIRAGESPENLATGLATETLGDYGRTLIEAYARKRSAIAIANGSREAADVGAIAGRIQTEREREKQTADAALASLMEQALFDVGQKCKQSTAAAEAAQRDVDIVLQRLNALLGPAAPVVTQASFSKVKKDTLSSVDLVSPIDGTVEERLLTATERVSVGLPIFTIADTTHLWAEADIRQSDWNAITVGLGQVVTISAPAIADTSFEGKVIVVGRRVNLATGAAPLVASITSSDSRLRPGMFIRMTVPTAEARDVIAVPTKAVVVHENQTFVFVADSDTEFRRVDVATGEQQNEMTEITSGLKVGDQVVVEGVFKLKSEILLAGEEE
ncbi:efflux RND transporter periplasmic adaptor subunit [Novipirellula sp. SH528]|uniref:efflux RND transporter periplasmic adaptor subunit n=1 Tax=Novipirellula sp. SH528 TaxID=3454466 RepID=UPI003FA0E710